MSKVKYYYDHDTLSYREIKVTNKNRISGVLLFLLASFFFGITSLLILLNSDIINTPSEVAQKRSLENFKLQFDILNKKLGQLEKVIANRKKQVDSYTFNKNRYEQVKFKNNTKFKKKLISI